MVERGRIDVEALVKPIRSRLGLDVDYNILRLIVNDVLLRERVFVSRFDFSLLK